MRMHPLLKKFTELGNHPDDSEDEKVRKSTLTVLAIPFAFAGLLWGVLYFANDLPTPGWIPFSYGLLSILSFVYFSYSKKYKFFRNSQLFLILILPFLLQLSLGGFIPSSAVILWGLISPLSALVFFKTKKSIGWFIAYVALLLIAYFANDYVNEKFDWDITEQFINTVFLLNILAVSALIYTIQYYYVGKQAELKEAIEEKSAALAEQTEKLKELDEAKSRFFANISHEFRTPLTLILGLINKQIASPELATNKKESEAIQRNANRLLQLINQLLDLSKLESGEIKLRASKTDIVGYTLRMFTMFESLAKGKHISLFCNGLPLSDNCTLEPINIYFDQEKYQKMITNLISNAVKFTPGKGIVELVINKDENNLIITIANSGEGIPRDALPYVFDRFYQVDEESTREYEGTGIGLALVRELTELHHGSISVESNDERTTFKLILPNTDSHLSEEEKIEPTIQDIDISDVIVPIKSTPATYDKPVLKGISIEERKDQLEVLVVEDNEDLRSYVKSILVKEYKIHEAKDGIEGMEKAEMYVPDLIVSDVMMPKMDGYALCKHLKTNPKTDHIPVILLTAKATQENKIEGLETGADAYLVKPFDEAELEVRIRNLIQIRAALQEKYQDNLLLNSLNNDIPSVHDKFIVQIKEVIEAEIDNDQFSVEDLGEAMAMSRSQVHRKLKALTDQSATQFIRNYRLYKAADLLLNNTGNITEIAYQVGFSSQTYFSSSFQELFGCSPSDYKVRN
jgi:signal transduction histidine kinase/DNA-binding response OmpR family regulator